MSQLTQREQEILMVCASHAKRNSSNISVYHIAPVLGISVDRAGRYLRSLVKKGKLVRLPSRELVVSFPERSAPRVLHSRNMSPKAKILRKIQRAKKLYEELMSLLGEIEREVLA